MYLPSAYPFTHTNFFRRCILTFLDFVIDCIHPREGFVSNLVNITMFVQSFSALIQTLIEIKIPMIPIHAWGEFVENYSDFNWN